MPKPLVIRIEASIGVDRVLDELREMANSNPSAMSVPVIRGEVSGPDVLLFRQRGRPPFGRYFGELRASVSGDSQASVIEGRFVTPWFSMTRSAVVFIVIWSVGAFAGAVMNREWEWLLFAAVGLSAALGIWRFYLLNVRAEAQLLEQSIRNALGPGCGTVPRPRQPR